MFKVEKLQGKCTYHNMAQEKFGNIMLIKGDEKIHHVSKQKKRLSFMFRGITSENKNDLCCRNRTDQTIYLCTESELLPLTNVLKIIF